MRPLFLSMSRYNLVSPSIPSRCIREMGNSQPFLLPRHLTTHQPPLPLVRWPCPPTFGSPSRLATNATLFGILSRTCPTFLGYHHYPFPQWDPTPARPHVPMLAYVLHLVNARVPPASTAHPVKFVQRDSLGSRARHALRAVQIAMMELPVQSAVSHLRRSTSHRPVIVLTAFVVPMDNIRATQAGPEHPTALNVQLLPLYFSSMEMVIVPFADRAANNARMAAASVSLASKALPMTLTTAQSARQCNR